MSDIVIQPPPIPGLRVKIIPCYECKTGRRDCSWCAGLGYSIKHHDGSVTKPNIQPDRTKFEYPTRLNPTQ